MVAHVVAGITDPDGFRACREAMLPAVAAFGSNTLNEPQPEARLKGSPDNAWEPLYPRRHYRCE